MARFSDFYIVHDFFNPSTACAEGYYGPKLPHNPCPVEDIYVVYAHCVASDDVRYGQECILFQARNRKDCQKFIDSQ